jgi:hypothetical protein
MKQQISNRHIPGYREQFIFIMITAAAIAVLYFLSHSNTGFSMAKFIMASVLLVLFFSVWYFISYARYYKVEADHEFLYFSRFLKMEKLDISRILYVQLESIPMNILYRNVYRVSVVYLDKKRKERKIKFLSVENKHHDSREKIKSLFMLKHLIRFKTGSAISGKA